MIQVTEITADSIERIVCHPIEDAPKYPMNEKTTKLLIRLLMASEINNLIKDSDKPFLYQFIEKRLQLFTFKISDARLILFLSVISRNPGTAVMYLWYLQYWSRNRRIKNFNLNYFCEMFPIGFPDEETFQKIWDDQKVNADGIHNLVDIGKAGESLITN